jgi:RNA polymerase sigma-70 factor (ECF subfamily)
MSTPERLAEQFEEHRSHARAVAYRMLGSVTEAEDAVQEAWIRLSRTDVSAVENLRGWLTTVVSRVCLDMLRSRASRREEPLDTHVPDPIITRASSHAGEGPEADAMLADSVALALPEAPPDHSTVSRTRRLIDLETHEAVFTWMLQCLADAAW